MAQIAQTPLMKQYEEMKKKHPDAILLFRVGDFYESFSDDAIATSEILGITLTRRANGSARSIELAGFPHHALDTYLPKLIRAGKRVAIYEQLKDGEGKYDCVEEVTPGKQESEKSTEGIKIKEINCICDIEQMREKGEPIAYFTIDIPKEAKNIGNCADKNFSRPQFMGVCIEPGNNKMIVCNTKILHVIDAKCEGVWPEGKNGKPFQCNIDPKAISVLAGKLVDVAVWEKNGKLDITACEANGVRSQYQERNIAYPDYGRVIPQNCDAIMMIAQDSIQPLRSYLKVNRGKTKAERENRIAIVEASENGNECRVSVYEVSKSYGITSNRVGEPLVVKIDRCDTDVKIAYNAHLLYFAVEDDFNGEIWPSDSRANKFNGEMRQTLLMPMVANYEEIEKQ